MIQRDIHNKVQQLSKKFPVVTITGPRQAGKTTLAKMAFPGYSYCNLEHPETGLASYLLGIENEKQVARDPLLGGLFENMAVIECVKSRTNIALDPNLYFYRDSHHNEVDLIHKQGEKLIPIEIKASQTYNPEFIKSLVRFRSISKNSGTGYIIYAGNQSFITNDDIRVIGFEKAMEIVSKPG